MVACIPVAVGMVVAIVSIAVIPAFSSNMGLDIYSKNTDNINNGIMKKTIKNNETPCFYYAAVVEFYQKTNFSLSAKESLAKNTAEYIEIIEKLKENNTKPLDLIIFPESTLADKTYPLPEIAAKIPPEHSTILCNSTDANYTEYLKNLSCAAMKFGTVIVVNFVEKEKCVLKNCTKNDVFFNTNVALGTDGTILARYRKFNLFGEPGITKPHVLDLPVFEIKNTSFGMMICFDIQFGSPGLELVRKMDVKNVIYPLRWISELPYLTALQTQQMWAQENDIILLASGANNAKNGAGGSGIYFGTQGPMQSEIFSDTKTKVFYQKIPINGINVTNLTADNMTSDVDSLAKDMDGFYMLVDPSIQDHNSAILKINATTDNLTLTSVKRQVCHGKFPNILCCDFDILVSRRSFNNTLKNYKSYTYQMITFNGVRTYSGLYNGGVETCGLVACLNETMASCGQRFPNYTEVIWPITFHQIKVTGNFSQSQTRIQFPTSLLSSIRPISPKFTSWTKELSNTESIVRTHALNTTQDRLLTFGIFGRDFARDSDPIRPSIFQTN